MKRIFGILILSAVFLSFTYQEMNGYITLFESGNNAKYFKAGKNHFFEFFDNKKATFDGKEYFIRYRKYSWGDIDTAYYRKGTDYYYHFNEKIKAESKVVPTSPKLGDTWFESDNSWSYEIIGVDKKFKTPAKKYKNCIKVRCKQLTNRDQQKSAEYILFYSPKYGYVGSVNPQGRISSYLSEYILNAKQGDKIGGKQR